MFGAFLLRGRGAALPVDLEPPNRMYYDMKWDRSDMNLSQDCDLLASLAVVLLCPVCQTPKVVT